MERSELKLLLKRLIAIAITVILCEIFIFNYASISSFIRCKNEASLDLTGATLHNIELTDDGRYCVTGPDAYIRISDINTNVNTLYINAHSTKEQLQVKFSYNDETITEALRTNGYVNIISGNEHSKFSLCSFSGNVDIFKFYFNEGEGENVIIESIIINKKIPFQYKGGRKNRVYGHCAQKDRNLSFIIRTFVAIATTVGQGVSPCRLAYKFLPRVSGLYHRYGISPIPKNKFDLY